MKDQVREVICDVFGLDTSTDDLQLTSERIADWDSVTHLTLILSLESRFEVQFDPAITSELHDLETLTAALQKLTNS